MARLLDIINSNKSLKQVYKYLELSFHTSYANVVQNCLSSFQVNVETLTMVVLDDFCKNVVDEMTKKGFSFRDLAEIKNILNVYGNAAIEVQSEMVPDTSVDIEWAISYYDFVRNIYNPELQILWSKILEIEVKKPQTFFKRTLDVFYRADRFEIAWFFEITKFVFDKACVPEFILTNNKFYPFNQFQTLIDAGFVNASLGSLSYHDGEVAIHLTSADFKIEITKPPFGFSIYTLTDAGSQLFDLRPETNSEEYLSQLKEFIEKRNTAKVSTIIRK